MIHKITMSTPFAVGDVNAYLLKEDALSLIDAGPNTEEALHQLTQSLQSIGYERSDIEQVFLTHHHPDHAGLLEFFPNAKIYGHAYNDLWLQRDPAFFQYHDTFYLERLKEEGVPSAYFNWVEKMKRPIHFLSSRPLDGELRAGEMLPGHSDWEIIETLGHAQSHLSFIHIKNRIAFGGDHVLEKISSNPLIEPPLDPNEERPRAMLQYNEALKRIMTYDLETIYSGHGNEVKNSAQLIAHRLDKQHERAMKVFDFIKKQPSTIFQLTQQLFPKVYEKELGLTLSETIGQVDYLVDEGYVNEIKNESGIFIYEAK